MLPCAVNLALSTYYIDHAKYPEKKTFDSQNPLLKLHDQKYMNSSSRGSLQKGLEDSGSGIKTPSNMTIWNRKIRYRKIRARIAGTTTKDPTTSPVVYNRTPRMLKSIGPDQTHFLDEGGGRGSRKRDSITEYNPTNGVFSLGEIIRVQDIDF